jgi:RimJ/RimL family protein N-acetyltransferase
VIKPPDTFTTARLRARVPRVGDAAAAFQAYANDPEVTRFLTWKPHERIETLAVFLLGSIINWENGKGPFNWMLSPLDSDAIIGSIGVTIADGKAMFGYVLARSHWGRGLMPEALGWLVGWSLAQPEIFRAYAFCDVENAASARVMEKAGMAREGVLRRWHTCPTISPEPRDCVMFAKVR